MESRIYAARMNTNTMDVPQETGRTPNGHTYSPRKTTMVESLPQILRRVAHLVEPPGFRFVPHDLPPSLLDGICEDWERNQTCLTSWRMSGN
jgi:hypothetical protein